MKLPMSMVRTVFLVAMFVVLSLALTAAGAGAAQSFQSASLNLSAPNGDFEHLAGGHPNLRFSFSVPQQPSGSGEGVEWPAEGIRDVNLELPPGFVGNPTSVPACPMAKFYKSSESGLTNCPVASQVGRVFVHAIGNNNQPLEVNVGLYNLVATPEEPARFGFIYQGIPVFIGAAVRPGDYGVDSGVHNADQTAGVYGTTVELWGVPADASHDAERLPFRSPLYPPFLFPLASEAPPKPLLRNPTSCGGAQGFTAKVDSWEHPGTFGVANLGADPGGVPFAFEQCAELSFKPAMTVHTTSSAAEAPTGLQVDIEVPQNESPHGRSTSDVRKVVTTLPVGMAVSDSSAQGLGACRQADVGLGNEAAPTCPDSSKIGTVAIKTPLLEEELEGAVYLAQQKANPFGTTLALYMAVKGPGFYLKLPGRVDTDPDTGQLTATFDNTPQLPFEHLHLELKSGPRAPLSNPRQCGTYAVKSEIVPWSGTAPVVGESTLRVDAGCPSGQFAPGLKTGTVDSQGGSYSPFFLRVTRADGEQNLARIKATLPAGLLAKLAGVTVCGDAQAAAGSCPSSSQVGTTTVGVGAGPSPVFVPEPGKAPTAVYLAGPYKGAPYSLVVKVPAQAGPFDLGTVTVRNALQIDPMTTQVTAESDPLPQVLEGIPIAYRDVRVEINRKDFTLNPTNCEARTVAAVIGGAAGGSASPSVPFAATNCERLGFGPSLKLAMSGSTKRAGNPALTATLKAPEGQSNIASTTVIMPKTVFIDQGHVNNPCTRVQFAAEACPPKSILGTAVAYTPLLDKPLEGPVYFRSNGGERQLPDLVADLHGQIHVILVGFIDSKKLGKESSLVRTRFASVPDAPVSKFVLKLKGGKRGLIQNSANLCRARPKAEVKMAGQNGKAHDFKAPIQVRCGGKGSKGKGKNANHK